MRKRTSFIVAFVVIAMTLTITASSVERNVVAGATTENISGIRDDNKKEKKKKEKKNKKDKEVKSPEEIIAMLQAIEWKKPAPSGLEVDRYYNDADTFFTMIKQVDEQVPLFKVCKIVSPSGENTIAPVDMKTGQVRHKNEAFEQVMESMSFGTMLGLRSALLATGAINHSVQIAKDAIPFVGDPERKAANVQIAKAVKVFPMLKKLMDSQRNMMNRYFKDNANKESTDSVSDALAAGDADFLETLEMTDEELEAYMKAEAKK